MEVALQDSEDRLRAVFDSVSAGIVIIDPKRHVIVDANPFALRMVGCTKDQVVGSVCHGFVCPAEGGYCPITDLGEHVDNSESLLLRVDGRVASVLKSVTPIVYGGEECLLESFIDITERKRMEEELLKSKRLAAVGEAAAMVGHDLRNPLQSTSSTLYLVKKLLGSGMAQERDEALGLLEGLDGQVYYMDKIVSDLQDYARPMEGEFAEINLPELVGEVVSSVKVPGAVRVSNRTVGNPQPSAIVNPRLLKRALANLILNAVQAMPRGGDLIITSQRAQDSAVITIKDSGVGIARENLDKIFNPFFTTKRDGVGLGLSIVSKIVDEHGGSIRLVDKPGKGACFRVFLPRE
jgi:PAS domain S-box-containing protein